MLPALSVAVQLTAVEPWADTVNGALALVVPSPLMDPRVVPVQLIAVMLLPPVAESFALTVPVAGEVLNQPLLPSGVNATVTRGAVESATTAGVERS